MKKECCNEKVKLFIDDKKEKMKIYRCANCGSLYNEYLKKLFRELKKRTNGWIIPEIKEK